MACNHQVHEPVPKATKVQDHKDDSACHIFTALRRQILLGVKFPETLPERVLKGGWQTASETDETPFGYTHMENMHNLDAQQGGAPGCRGHGLWRPGQRRPPAHPPSPLS